MHGVAFGAAFGRLVFCLLWIIGSVVALGLSGATPAYAACVQNGPNVTCTGTTPEGFGDGTQDLLFVNVVPGATLFGNNPAAVALFIRDGNMVINSGTLSSTGLGGIGLGMNDGNLIINNGSIIGGANGFSIAGGFANTIVNTGTIDGPIFLFGLFNTVTNSGLITITNPGTDIGAFHLIGGDYIQTATGTLALRVNGLGQFDGLAADTAVLAGTLRAVVQPGLYANSTFYQSIIQACGCGGVIGTFDRVVSSSIFFNATAAVNAFGDGVDLTLTRIPFGSVPGLTQNQRNVGNALESSYSTALTGNLATFYGNLLAATSAGVLDQISGEGTTGTQTAAFSAATMFNSVLMGQVTYWKNGGQGGPGFSAYAPVAYAPTFSREHPAFAALKAVPSEPPRPWRVWASGFGGNRTLTGDPVVVGSGDLKQRTGGGAAGLDYTFSPNLTVGAAIGGSTSSFYVSSRATDGTVDAGHIGTYGIARWAGFYAAGVVSYSRFENSTTRTIAGIGALETATAKFSSDLLSARVEIGRPIDFWQLTVTPFAAMEISELWQRAYNETSPGILGLSFAARSVTSLPTFLGMQFDSSFVFPNGTVWTPYTRVSWVHEFYPNREVTASLLGITPWTVAGPRAARDSLKVDGGSRVALTPAIAFYANVNGEFAEHSRLYTASGGMRYAW